MDEDAKEIGLLPTCKRKCGRRNRGGYDDRSDIGGLTFTLSGERMRVRSNVVLGSRRAGALGDSGADA